MHFKQIRHKQNINRFSYQNKKTKDIENLIADKKK